MSMLGHRQWHYCSSYQLDSDFSHRFSWKSRYACLPLGWIHFESAVSFACTVQKVMGGTRVRIHMSGKDGAMVGNQKTLLSSEFMGRIALLEKIHLSWDNFPYYTNEHAKSTLVECSTAHLKHKELTGAHLASPSGRILLQSVPGFQ